MTKIEGYEDCHIVNESNGGEIRQGECAQALDMGKPSSPTNTTHLNVGTTQQDGAYALSGCSQTSRDGLGDSCERSMGDASTRKDEVTLSDEGVKPVADPSPTIIKAAKAMAALHGDNAHYSDESYLVWLDEAEVAFKVFQEGGHTREELSALIAKKMCDYGEYYSYNTDGMADAALDALIELGVVKCK